METFVTLSVIFCAVSIICLKRKFNWGVVPTIVISCIVAGILSSIIETVKFYNGYGPNIVEVEERIFENRDSIIDMEKTNIFGSIIEFDEVNRVIRDDTLKTSYLSFTKTYHDKDIGLFFNVGTVEYSNIYLHLNKEDYAIYKAFRDSCKEGENTLR